jgi:hypothetical protein
MSLLDPINSYCERSGPGLLDEPINAFSNIAFFIAAYALYRLYRKRNLNDRQILTLIIMLALIGCGSTLFHTFANELTMLGDVIPISAFTFTYLWFSLRSLLHLSKHVSVALLAVFAVVGALAPHVPDSLQFNASVAYFPCLAALIIISAALVKNNRPAAIAIFRAASWFAVSLLYRSLDITLCATMPYGTHFLWHTINGWVLYLLVTALLHKKDANAD